MTWFPLAYLPPQYVNSSGVPYSGAVLKAYRAGTTTPITMATSSAGTTTATIFALNAAGYPVSSGAVIIPHVQESPKMMLYPTQAAADANSGEIWSYDAIAVATAANADRYINYAVDTGTANAYIVAPDPTISAYSAGQIVTLKPTNTNTGASTLAVSGLPAKNIKTFAGLDPAAGALSTAGMYQLSYDGTNFIILGEGSFGGFTQGAATSKYIFGVSGFDNTGATVTANRLYAHPIVITQAQTFTRIGIKVTAFAAGNARIGLYNAASGIPTTLLLDAGVVLTGTNGEKEITISQLLNPGVYYAVVVFDATPDVAFGSIGAADANFMFGQTTLNTIPASLLRTAFTYAALPASFGTVAYSTGSGPIVWLRVV